MFYIRFIGTELFTGNTVTMFMLLFNDGKKALIPLVRIWTISLIGNLAGAIFGAFLITWASGVFVEGTSQLAFLYSMSYKKIGRTFGENVILGVNINLMFVNL